MLLFARFLENTHAERFTHVETGVRTSFLKKLKLKVVQIREPASLSQGEFFLLDPVAR
jgi:hypothetical protein